MSQTLYEALRRLARRARRAQSHPFYPLRTVATHFDVAITTVAKVYRRLERDGLLTCVRSSGTFVAPRRQRTRAPVRAVVSLPVWLPGFLQFRDWRRFVGLMEMELRRCQMVADLVFYGIGDDAQPAFADRVLARNPDALVWWCPHITDVDALRRFADAGVRVWSILDQPLAVPGRACRLEWQRGLSHAMKVWRQDGIVRVVTPRPAGSSTSQTHVLKGVLDALGLTRGAAVAADNEPSPEYVSELAQASSTGVVFDDDLWFARLCHIQPREMLSLFQRVRCLVMREVTLPVGQLPPLHVDVLSMDLARLARNLADAVATPDTRADAAPLVVHPVFHPRVPLGQMVQTNWQT